jgi:hypothetical protein
MRTIAIASLFIALTASFAARAAPTFEITSLYSNLDGSDQFIRLTESAGANGQNQFAGVTLTIARNGTTKTFTFPRDLPTHNTAHASIVIQAGYGYAYLNDGSLIWLGSDYGFPSRFLATDGATVAFADADFVTYASLPTDGENGLLRDGSVTRYLLPAGLCHLWSCNGDVPIWPSPVAAVEYYHAGLDHYFLSASAPDIDALDSGRTRGWQRTGQRIAAAASVKGFATYAWDDPFIYVATTPLCRFRMPPAMGNSHFLSAFATECAEVRARFPAYVLESEAAFYAALPDAATGECPRITEIWGTVFELVPVYRLWNARADSNHRYTVDPAVRREMIAKGYVPEGYGPDGVAFCVPAS